MDIKIIKAKRKTIAMQILPDCSIIVKAPKNISEKYLNDFILSKLNWAEKRIKEIKIRNDNMSCFSLDEGDKIFWYGVLFTIKKCDQIIIDEEKKEIFIYFKNKIELIENLKKLYILEAKRYLLKQTEKISKEYLINYKSIKINSAKSHWGSMNINGNINLSFRLIMLKPEIINYIIIHELCHKKQMNHTEKFYDEIKNILPDYKKDIKELKLFQKNDYFKFLNNLL